MWRFKGDNNYQNLIAYNLITGSLLRDNLDVKFIIENNEFKWSNIENSNFQSFNQYLMFGAMMGLGNIVITDVSFNENDQTIITFENGETLVLDLLVETKVVNFKDENGQILKTERLSPGFNATPPSYEKEGYTVSWDRSFDNVITDLEVNVVLTPNQYQINFDYDGINPINVSFMQQIVNLPVPTKQGYIFDKWVNSEGLQVKIGDYYNLTTNLTLTPVFVVEDLEATYKKLIYKNVNDSYELIETLIIDSEAGEVIDLSDHTMTGYHLNTRISNTSGTVLKDNTLELELYFDNNKYQITFSEVGILPRDVYYDREITHLPSPEKIDHTFVHWHDIDNVVYSVGDLYLLTENLELTAKFTPNETTYLVKTYLQDLNGNYPLEVTDEIDSLIGETVSASKTIDGYHLNLNYSITSGTVSSSQLELKLYFDLNEYTISFDYDGVNDLLVKHTQKLSNLPVLEEEGYNFLGWVDDKNVTITSESVFDYMADITLTPNLVLKEIASYTEEIYFDGQLKETNNKIGYVDEEVNINTNRDGLTLNSSMSSVSGIVLSDDSLVLKAYFDTNRYYISFKDDHLNDIFDPIAVLYGYEVGALPTPSKNALIFRTWVDHNGNYYDENTVFLETRNIELLTIFDIAVNYTINFYTFSNLNNEYNFTHQIEKTGYDGEVVTPMFEIPYGYEIDLVKSSNPTLTLNYDFNNHINVYFKYKNFDVTYLDSDGSFVDKQELPYETILGVRGHNDLNIPEGFKFSHWELFGEKFDPSAGLRVYQDLEFKAVIEIKEIIYQVKYVYLKHDEDELAKNNKISSFREEAFKAVSHIPIEQTGFNLLPSTEFDSLWEATLGSEDLTTTLVFYFREILYEAIFLDSDNQEFSKTTNTYNKLIPLPSTNPELAEHSFVGWTLNGELVTSPSLLIFTKDFVFEPLFDLNTAVYYIDYYFENYTGNFTLGQNKQLTSIVGREVSAILYEDLIDPPLYEFGEQYIFDEDNSNNVFSKVLEENTYDQATGNLIATRLKVHYKYVNKTISYHVLDDIFEFEVKYGTILNLGEDLNDNLNLSENHLELLGWVFDLYDQPELTIDGYQLLTDINLYAIIEPISYEIVLIDGDDIFDTLSIPYGSLVILPIFDTINGETRHQFIGWMDNNNDLRDPIFRFLDGKDITLYANWFSSLKLYEFNYRSGTNNTEVEITNYLGRNLFERIPENLGNAQVTKIGPNAFKGNPYLEHVELGSFEVWEYAFSEMPKLKKVTTYALGNTSNDLESLNSKIYFGDYVFKDNLNLTTVDFSRTSLMNFGIGLFENNPKLKKVSLPVRLIEIPEKTFYNAISLEEVVQPGFSPTLTRIGEKAFYGTSSLKKLVKYEVPYYLPNALEIKYGLDVYQNLEVISKSAFENSGLQELILPSSMMIIDNKAFLNTKLTEVNLIGKIYRVGDQAFFGLNHLESININSTEPLVTLGMYAFGDHNNHKLEYVLLESNISTNSSYTPFAAANELNIFLDQTSLVMSTWGGKHNVYFRDEWELDENNVPQIIP